MNEEIVSLSKVKKSFRGIPVLRGINMDIHSGSIHGLLGLNGVGKSTLINILSGVFEHDYGQIIIDGKQVHFSHPKDAKKLGFSTVFQSSDFIPDISVAEFFFLSETALDRKHFQAFDPAEINNNCKDLLDKYSVDVRPTDKMMDLTRGQLQMVSIISSLLTSPRLLMLDEPFNSLTYLEKDNLFGVFKKLRDDNIAILIVLHDLNDVHDLCDEITILEDGVVSAHFNVNDPGFEEWTITHLSGGGLKRAYPYILKNLNRAIMTVDGLYTTEHINDVSFYLRKGEILGVTGMINSGKNALAHALFGTEPIKKGTITINGQKVQIRSPRQAIKNKIAYISANLIREGIIPSFSVSNNISLSSLEQITTPLINPEKEKDIALDYIKRFVIRTPSANEPTKNLSFGNQQKVNIAKWLFTDSKIIIMDDPTQYLDISSKVEIYNLMNKFTSSGGSILFISSDIDELLGMSDRILVMKHGTITGTLKHSEFGTNTLKSMME